MRDIEPTPGEERIITWFAWLPVRIGREMRWLESVTVSQVYAVDTESSFDHQWLNLEFK